MLADYNCWSLQKLYSDSKHSKKSDKRRFLDVVYKRVLKKVLHFKLFFAIIGSFYYLVLLKILPNTLIVCYCAFNILLSNQRKLFLVCYPCATDKNQNYGGRSYLKNLSSCEKSYVIFEISAPNIP